jgi:hypothetical protein
MRMRSLGVAALLVLILVVLILGGSLAIAQEIYGTLTGSVATPLAQSSRALPSRSTTTKRILTSELSRRTAAVIIRLRIFRRAPIR